MAKTLRIGAYLLASCLIAGALVMHLVPRWRAEDEAQAPGFDWRSASQSDPRLAAAFDMLNRKGLGAALDVLEKVAAEDSTVLRNGHQLAHALGRQAVAARGGDPSVVGECSASFGSGCYHGVVEAFVQSHGTIDMARLERMCLGAGSAEQPGPIYECTHGLGHGVLGASGSDLEQTLRHCDALSAPTFETACHSGAFMEAINLAVAPAPTSTTASHEHQSPDAGHSAHGMHGATSAQRFSIDSRDPYSPCDRFGDPYADSCWIFQGFLILRHNGFNTPDAFRICDKAPSNRAALCYKSIGHQLTGLFQHDDSWIIRQCDRGQRALASYCIAGAAMALDQIDWSGGRAASLCLASPTPWRDACYRSAAGNLTTLASKADRTRLCARIEKQYAQTCREAAELVSRPAAAN